MTWLWAALTVLFGILVILLSSDIRCRIVFLREGHDDLFRITIRALFGLVRLKYEIPVIDWQGKSVSIKQEMVNMKKQELQKEGKAKINRKTIIDKYEELRELTAYVLDFSVWVKVTLSYIRCHEFEWVTKIGLGDAPDTAFTTGVIWSMKSSIAGLMLNCIRLVEPPKLSVVPLFHEEYFETRFQSRLSIRLGSALWAGVNLLIRILKVKGGLRTWRKHLARA